MTPETFAAIYNPLTRCNCTYKSAHGDTRTGIMLDDVKTSTTGTAFVYVDNFANRVQLADLQSLWDTGRAWSKKA